MPILLLIFLCLGIQVHAQDVLRVSELSAISPDTTFVDQTIDSGSLSYDQLVLPHKMMATQRVFWGPNGLLRVMNIAPLTREGRKKELDIRRFMLVAHQVTGYVTLAGFVVQGILEAKANNATGATYDQLLNAQQTTATITNIAYGTTALLSLTAPPKLIADRKTASRIRLHKYLSIIHLTGMVATNLLASKASQNAEFKSYHRVAGLTTFAAFAPALIALKF